MGNLSSCCLPNDKSEERREEGERLLHNPAEALGDGTSLNGHVTVIGNRDQLPSYGATETKGERQESSAWNRTLHKMATKVIDVSTMEVSASTIEQGDWIERQRLYASRINQTRISAILRKQREQKLMGKGDGLPESKNKNFNVSFEPISAQDIALINEFSDRSLQAIKQGFVVSVNEDLVVQFNP